MKILCIALFLAGMAGTGAAQVQNALARVDTVSARIDSLIAVPRNGYDSLRKTLRAAQDSLNKKLGFVTSVLNIPDVAGAVPELSGGWMPGFQSLKMDPNVLLKKAGFTGVPADYGDFGRLADITGAADPAAIAGKFSGEAGLTLPEMARDHFAEKKEALTGAMDALDRFKEKYHGLESLPDVNLKFVNTMKGKSFTERFIPGIRFRMIRRNPPEAEFTPMVAYRVTGKLSIGFGWTSRLKLDGGVIQPVAFGPMVSVDADAGKGLRLLAGCGSLKRMDGEGDRFTGIFTGLRKDFPVSRSITGYAAVQYSWNRRVLQLTPGDRFGSMMGIEFRLGGPSVRRRPGAIGYKPDGCWKGVPFGRSLPGCRSR